MLTKIVVPSIVRIIARWCVVAGLGLILVSAKAADTILVPADAVWRYSNAQTPPPPEWNAPDFNAESWKSGPAQLGYGDGDEATIIDGGQMTPRPVTAYFRASFHVDDVGVFTKLALQLVRDDGAVVYLNGVEALRSNMPEGPITPETLALTTVGPDVENSFVPFDLPPQSLVSGRNVIAVEVHQVNVSSSDASFALQLVGLSGELTGPPTLSIEATSALTSEPLPNALVTPGLFTIRRSAPTNTAFTAWVLLGGTASNGVDYESVTGMVRFAQGQTEAKVKILPREDELVEGNETVIAELIQPTTMGPVAWYKIDPERRRAVVTIKDEDAPARAQLQITSPPNGAAFPQGMTITVKATAVDPAGYIPRVEFYSGATLIGVSEITFVRAPEPGTPLEHAIQWHNAPVGTHILTARAVTAVGERVVSPPVTIYVAHVDPPPPVVLALEVVDASASELTNMDSFDTGTILIKRVSGPQDVALTAYYTLSGTASNGVDYLQLTGSVEMPAGAAQVGVRITAAPDDALEGDETVVLTLVPPVCPSNVFPSPECYLVGEPHSGTVTIRDFAGNPPPVVRIARPANGSVFTVGDVIEVVVEAADANGRVVKLELFNGDQLLASALETNRLAFRWSSAAPGEHILSARALDDAGARGTSPSVKILVRERDASAFVFRDLPAGYRPGIPFIVILRAEPPAGNRAYAVEDHPPTGWPVSDISNEGIFDAATGKVKFGPFTDGTARTLTYRVTPPTSATGRKEFAGVGSVDGASYPIGGDQAIELGPTLHPADTNHNLAIDINELTAYAAAWKRGESIPIAYVTRAGFLWKRGEAYKFDPTKEPPFCWIPAAEGPIALMAVGTAECERICPIETTSGVTPGITIRITPPAATSAYAVEEKIPDGWTVSGISDQGSFNPETGTIRWGMFLDATARTLSYTITPPAGVSLIGRLSGKVSFDGVMQEVNGGERLICGNDATRPVLVSCERDIEGNVRLTLSGAVGQVGVLQRSSNLERWEDVSTLFMPDGAVAFRDDVREPGPARYYRFQIR